MNQVIATMTNEEQTTYAAAGQVGCFFEAAGGSLFAVVLADGTYRVYIGPEDRAVSAGRVIASGSLDTTTERS